MRIAIVAEVFLPKIDGVVIRTLNLIEELQAAGDEVLVICPEVDAPRNSPVPIVEFPSFPFPSYPEYKIGRPDHRLPEAIREFQPDVIHFLNPFAFGFSCYDVLQPADLNIPIVFSFHTLYAEFVKRYGALKPLSRLLWWLTRHYHNCAQANLTVSSIMKDELEQLGFQRVKLWPPAVDTTLFDPARSCPDMRQRLAGGSDTRPLLLTVSRLAPEKDVEFLADVLEQLPNAVLAIAGDGPHRPALEKRFAGLPARFAGYLRGEELAKAYASADAFVYASQTETMGNVILESLASGTPVVAPRAGGIPSLVEHGRTGLLFEPGDVTTAAGHIQSLLADSRQWQELADAGRESTRHRDWYEAAMSVRADYETAITTHTRMPRTSITARAVLKLLVNCFRLTSALTKQEVPAQDVGDQPNATQQREKVGVR